MDIFSIAKEIFIFTYSLFLFPDWSLSYSCKSPFSKLRHCSVIAVRNELSFALSSEMFKISLFLSQNRLLTWEEIGIQSNLRVIISVITVALSSYAANKVEFT